jgi:DNA-binding Lrp family transcriptional regulator
MSTATKTKQQSVFGVWLPPEVIAANLNPYEIAAYIAIVRHASFDTSEAFPSYSTIAARANMSRTKAIECVKALVESGLITKETRHVDTVTNKKRQTSNLYSLQTESGRRKDQSGRDTNRGSGAPDDHKHIPKDLEHKTTEPTTQDSDDVAARVSSLLRRSVSAKTMARLRNLANDEVIVRSAEEVANRRSVSNPIGYLCGILENGGVTAPATSVDRTELGAELDDKYSAFYDFYGGDGVGAPAVVEKSVESTHSDVQVDPVALLDSAKEMIRGEIGRASFDTWFSGCEAMRFECNMLVVRVSNDQTRDWIESRYSALLKSTLEKIAKREVAVKFVLDVGESDGTEAESLWRRVLANLETKVSKPTFETWLRPIKLVRITSSTIVLLAQSEFHKEWIDANFKKILLEAIGGSVSQLEIMVP